MKSLILFIFIFFSCICQAQEIENISASGEAVTSVDTPASSSNTISTSVAGNEKFQFLKGQTTLIKNPFELRDPFKRESKRVKGARKSRFTPIQEGELFTNLPSITNVPLEKIKITGILVGRERRAMAKVEGDQNTYILKEGMFLGVDNAEIKAILPGGVVLVEKIRNVYDQDEYLETILTISE